MTLAELLEFQSTPPAWGATSKPPRKNKKTKISIHAPRVGGDARRDWMHL